MSERDGCGRAPRPARSGTAALLTHLGAPTERPAVAAARAPPQVALWPGRFDPPAGPDAYDPA